MRIVGGGYVDDKAPLAGSIDGLNHWYLHSGLYCGFHGAKVSERFARFLNERYWQFDPDLTGARQEGVDSGMGVSSRVQLSEEAEEQQGEGIGHKGEGGDRGGAVSALGNLPPAGADLPNVL